MVTVIIKHQMWVYKQVFSLYYVEIAIQKDIAEFTDSAPSLGALCVKKQIIHVGTLCLLKFRGFLSLT